MKFEVLAAGILACATAPIADAQLQRAANSSLNLPAGLPSATGYTTGNALGTLTFNQPIATASINGETGRLFVAERGGVLKVVGGLTGTPTSATYLQLTSILGPGETLTTTSECGFLSVAFHPDFADNGTLFVYYSLNVNEGSAKLFQRLHRIVVSDPGSNSPTIASDEPLLTIVDRAGNHNGGSLGFGPDGYLYLSLGDEGNGGDSFNNARFINQRYDPANSVLRTGFWGQMLRLDVDERPENLLPNPNQQNSSTFPSAVHAGTYRVPADNPFIGYTSWHNLSIDPLTVRTEIWATGLRNPFRWSFDKPTGRLFLADVGQSGYEEIDIIVKGGDYGWSWREGLHAYISPPAPTSPPASGFNPIDPIYEYDRVNNGNGNDAVLTGNSVTGGAVYRGNTLTELFGAYIFADYNSGAIVALRENAGIWTGERLATESGITHFGHNPADGEMIFCDINSSQVKRLTRSGTSGTQPPATLSALGAFTNLADLTPHPGVVPYDVNLSSWSDHATKQRWFAIRNLTDDVVFNRDTNWTLPTGMVWIKHFDFETTRGDPGTKRKLETRVLVKTDDASYGLSYRWRADQSDADLVPESGMNDPIDVTIGGIPTTQTWRFPSRGECMSCHTPAGGHALSFNTRQINRAHVYDGQTLNQITALSDAGYFSATVSGANTFPAFADSGDATQSLEWRVRSYFNVNCSQCHQPGGPATGNWDARATVATDSAQIINGMLVNNFGDPANRFAVPGDTPHSIGLQRLLGGPTRMPPLATNVIDQAGIDLLTDWINQDLPTRQSFSQWQLAEFGSPLPPEAAATEDPDHDDLDNRTEFLAGTDPNSPNSPSLLQMSSEDGTLRFDYSLPANRSMLIEASETLLPGSWQPWNVPGNSPVFPATGGPKVFESPIPETDKQFFRGRIAAP